jgi:hypothetical protein
VSHVNAVHEAYIAKALGVDAYRQLVAKLPSYLQESFVRERMNTLIIPMLSADDDTSMKLAA